jgi:hypothetical protein
MRGRGGQKGSLVREKGREGQKGWWAEKDRKLAGGWVTGRDRKVAGCGEGERGTERKLRLEERGDRKVAGDEGKRRDRKIAWSGKGEGDRKAWLLFIHFNFLIKNATLGENSQPWPSWLKVLKREICYVTYVLYIAHCTVYRTLLKIT